jgi:hypothetical protein
MEVDPKDLGQAVADLGRSGRHCDVYLLFKAKDLIGRAIARKRGSGQLRS